MATPPSAIKPGELACLAPSIRRLTAFNAGTMTGPGTNTWILGEIFFQFEVSILVKCAFHGHSDSRGHFSTFRETFC